MKIGRMAVGLAAFVAFLSSSPSAVMAMCPLCTAATVAAVAVTRAYGLDDIVVGIFIGGSIMSTVFWINRVLLRRHKGKSYIQNQFLIILLVSLLSTVATFYFAGMLGSQVQKYLIFGIDRILVGSVLGMGVSLAAPNVNQSIRSLNGGKNYLPLQMILVTLGMLAVTVFGFYMAGLI